MNTTHVKTTLDVLTTTLTTLANVCLVLKVKTARLTLTIVRTTCARMALLVWMQSTIISVSVLVTFLENSVKFHLR